MKNEIWKDIPGYEGIYEASTFGRIRTKEGKVTHSIKHGKRVWKSRILKYRGTKPSPGYRVSLWKDKKDKDMLVARLVAMTFLGEPEPNMTVNHIDNNRLNNRIENLEWLTLADNIKAGFETGAFPQHNVLLIDKNGDEYKFRSKVKAAEFLGRSHGYINHKRKGIAESTDGNIYKYEITKCVKRGES